MYLKSITLKGFKSFPERTRLELGPGVSVIVGPNGSGKSNVTDAVLWALGEQSPVAVRGQTMQDVIFGGAPGRQAGRAAEVELVLDDSEGRLGLGAPEVSIFRRLDRSGEGEYRLAGARCRLVDILEVLSDTGLGKEMHSVISQGRVEGIVTSKPRDRRLLIEEAAGLGKHRKRRRRAQLKLARTQDNLDRALDVEREARSRLRPLKRQAEAAELHARLERQTLEARWELARERLRSQLAALAQAEREVSSERERRTELEQRSQAVAAQREQAEEALALRSSRREELSRRCFSATSAEERIGYRAEAVRAAASSLQVRLERRQAQLEHLEGENASDRPDPEAQSRIDSLQSQIAALDRNREAELSRQLAELERELVEAAGVCGEREHAVEQARQARLRCEASYEQSRQAVREAERALEATRREAARIGGELAAVNQFLRSQASAPGDAVSLSDQLEVDPGYEHALAAALDGRLRAAIVSDLAAGTQLLNRSGVDGGRALVGLGEEVARNGSPGQPPAGAERLLDHVRGRGESMRLACLLLGEACVVDDLADLPDSFAGVAVTRGGRVWVAATRELRQASAHGEERVLAERNRREELVRASEGAAAAEHQARSELERISEQVSLLDSESEREVAAHREAIRRRDEASEQEQRLAAQIQRRRSAPDDGPDGGRRAQLDAELTAELTTRDRRVRERTERQGRLQRLRLALEHDRGLGPAIAAVLEALDDATNAISERRAGFEAELDADREAGEHLAGKLRTCAQREAALHAELQSVNEALTQQEVRAQRVRDQAADAEQELRELAGRLELEASPAERVLADEERQALSHRLERLVRRREQLGPVNPLAQEEYQAAVEHVEELERQRGDLEAALRELQKLIADTDKQIRDTFEETFKAAASNFEELAAHLFPGGKGRLRLVTEAAPVGQHLGPARVLGAQPSPRGGSVDTDAAASESDGDDGESIPEEDLLGVEIEITPAGKAMKRLSLLSGGEKSMTALAFLFSVFLAKPCPFYVLDEVEAALDDLNIDRFLALLAQYSTRAQFIVVTHQKRTMEAADSLYGISMGGDGISKVISRRLPRAA